MNDIFKTYKWYQKQINLKSRMTSSSNQTISVKKIQFEGKTYLRSSSSDMIIYDFDEYMRFSIVQIGYWCKEKQAIVFYKNKILIEEQEEDIEDIFADLVLGKGSASAVSRPVTEWKPLSKAEWDEYEKNMLRNALEQIKAKYNEDYQQWFDILLAYIRSYDELDEVCVDEVYLRYLLDGIKGKHNELPVYNV